MLVTIARYLFLGGALSIFFIIGRKIPFLRAIPGHALPHQETFREFVSRKIHEIPELPAYFSHVMLTFIEKNLHRAKILSLRLHNVFDGWRTSIRHKKNGTHPAEASPETEHITE